jgi:hypothetical protein
MLPSRRGCTASLLVPLLLGSPVSAGRLSVIYSEYADGGGPLHLSVIDPSSGTIDSADARTIAFPPSDCDPGWSLSNGTNGQTFTVFPMNQSVFIMAQETCRDHEPNLRNTTLFSLFAGVFEDDFAAQDWWVRGTLRDGPNDVRAIASFPNVTGDSVLDLNIDWDHVCNVLVVAPVPADPENNDPPARDAPPPPRQILQVSEYDGEVRPKGVFPSPARCGYPTPPGGCWRRVGGLSAVDAHPIGRRLRDPEQAANGTAAVVAEQQEEANCGNCSYYFLEEQMDGLEVVAGAPRQLIGRSVMNGTLTLNVTEPTQLLSLSFVGAEYGNLVGLPRSGLFLGVGVCCELAWCPPECEGHGGVLSLVGWVPGPYQRPTVLAVAPGATADAGTAQVCASSHRHAARPANEPTKWLAAPASRPSSDRSCAPLKTPLCSCVCLCVCWDGGALAGCLTWTNISDSTRHEPCTVAWSGGGHARLSAGAATGRPGASRLSVG